MRLKCAILAALASTVAGKKAANSHIVGGVQATTGEYPFFVNLRRGIGNGKTFCGASIISEEWAITAAHCVDEKGTQASPVSAYHVTMLVGTVDSSFGGYRLKATEAYTHPNWSGGEDDVALIRAESAFPLHKSTVDVIKIGKSAPAELSEVRTMGYGSRSEQDVHGSIMLLNTRLRLQSKQQCEKVNKRPTPTTMCAQAINAGENPCYGDSGGPLVYRDSASQPWKLVGLTSFGARQFSCEDSRQLVYFANLELYQDWISEVTGIPLSTLLHDPSAPPQGPAQITSFSVAEVEAPTTRKPTQSPTLSPTLGERPNSCYNKCGEKSGRCYCDRDCARSGDCCSNIKEHCQSYLDGGAANNNKGGIVDVKQQEGDAPAHTLAAGSVAVPTANVDEEAGVQVVISPKPAQAGSTTQTHTEAATKAVQLVRTAFVVVNNPTSAPPVQPSVVVPLVVVNNPTTAPADTDNPTRNPTTLQPTPQPTRTPTTAPTSNPTRTPTSNPTSRPTRTPTTDPTPFTMPTPRPAFRMPTPRSQKAARMPTPQKSAGSMPASISTSTRSAILALPPPTPQPTLQPTPQPTNSQPSNSCQGICGETAPNGCFCDSMCKHTGDCCADYQQLCEGQCQGMCGRKSGDCWCDHHCDATHDCCPDRDTVCGTS